MRLLKSDLFGRVLLEKRQDRQVVVRDVSTRLARTLAVPP
jgi:hypothetical protein